MFSLITSFLLLMQLLVLRGVADGFVGKLQKVSSVTIMLRKYQASQMLSSKDPQPQVPHL